MKNKGLLGKKKEWIVSLFSIEIVHLWVVFLQIIIFVKVDPEFQIENSVTDISHICIYAVIERLNVLTWSHSK